MSQHQLEVLIRSRIPLIVLDHWAYSQHPLRMGD